MTNVPSDVVCSDEELQEEEGLYYDGREHRVVQKPVALEVGGTVTGRTLVFVHHHQDSSKSYIFSGGGVLYNGSTAIGGLSVGNGLKVQAIGNILVVRDEGGVHYVLWKDDGYNYLGDRIPVPEVKFRVGGTLESAKHWSGKLVSGETINIEWSCSLGDSDFYRDIYEAYVVKGARGAYNDLVIGLYSKNLNSLRTEKLFSRPFFACCALELYDGSYIYQSAPQLLFPSVRHSTWAKTDPYSDYFHVILQTYGHELELCANFDYSEFADIVKDVVVFVTEEAQIYDTLSDQDINPDGPLRSVVNGEVVYSIAHDYVGAAFEYAFVNAPDTTELYHTYFYPLKRYEDADIINNIKSLSVFYRLFSLGTQRSDANNVFTSTRSLIEPHVLENLTSQQQLPIDFYSRCSLNGGVVKCLNNRLHLGNVVRGFADIEEYIFPYGSTPGSEQNVVVGISTPSGDRRVEKTFTTGQRLDLYFYYPDPRAKIVSVDGRKYKLSEHPSLNGAFYLHALPGEDVDIAAEDTTDVLPTATGPETLPSQVWVSEVNNPFVFRPEGVVQVGSGEVMGFASLTTALSQGQFGEYPLVVFTNDGMWALNVGSTGVYVSARPMSREVMNRDAEAIEVDGAVYFTSKKGLMVVDGGRVACVSGQLQTDAFANCRMAYDYRDSMLYIFPESAIYGYEAGKYALLYGMKSGSFTVVTFDEAVGEIVADYPDYLIGTGTTTRTLLSFLGRPLPDDDERTVDAHLVSRPLKLGNGLALKSIMQLRTLCDFTPYDVTVEVVSPVSGETTETTESRIASGSLEIFGSNDLRNWKKLKGIRGVPWKYYRMELTLTGLLATDTVQGIVLVTQERRTNKIR